MEEVWSEVLDPFSNYLASNLGSIKSKSVGVSLSERLNKDGYPTVKIYDRCKKKTITIPVHRLVTSAFLGARAFGLQVNHLNGIKSDNRICNLEYCTPKQNTQHYHKFLKKHVPRIPKQVRLPRVARIKRQRKYSFKLLTESQVGEIRLLLSKGLEGRVIAKMFSISPATVSQIKTGKTHKC